MVNPYLKIKRTLNYHYYKLKKDWHFPSNIAHISAVNMAKGTYEPDVSHIIRKYLDKGSLFIDVGANIGYFSRMVADIVKPHGKVYAFEVEYDNYHALCRNTTDLINVMSLHFAVSNELCFMNVHHSSHSACHSLVKTDNHLDGHKFTVPTITMDHFWSNYLDSENIDLIKIDVEGAELFVLDGMAKMLSQNIVRTMIIEYCPRVLNNSGQDPLKIYKVLDKNFSLSIIEKEYRKLQTGRRIEGLEEFCKITDYLLELDDAVNINLLCEKS